MTDTLVGVSFGTPCRYGPFDVVWVSDCLNPIYGVDSYEKLARSVLHLAGPNTCVFLEVN